MAIIASSFAAASSHGPASRRVLLLLLALLLVGLALSVRPGEVSAAPSNVQLITTNFNVWNNSVRITFVDSTDYAVPNSNRRCYGYYVVNGTRRYYTQGVIADNTQIDSDCQARDITTSGINFGSGGSRTVGIRIRYTAGTQVTTTPSAYSNSYTFPTRPSITSFSVSGTILTVNWDSHAHTGTDLDWWIIASTSTSPSAAFASEMVAENSPSTRTATLDLSSYDLTYGEPIYLWVAVTSGTPSASLAHYLYWSNDYKADVDTLEECTEEDVLDLGYLTGYDHSIQGSFLNAPCEVNAKTSHAFKFRLASARDVDATFTPATDYGAGAGSYEVAIRRNSLDGLLLESGSGEASIEVDTFNIAPNLDYHITVSRSGTVGGDDWALSLAYGFIAPPTPTPAPTVTPRAQINVDLRLSPNPSFVHYENDQIYEFGFEGESERFPVTVRAGNSAALAVGGSSSLSCNTDNPSSDDSHEYTSPSSAVYIRTCAAGLNSTLELISNSGEILAEYSVFVAGNGPSPTLVPEGIPQRYGEETKNRDSIGLTLVIGLVCGGAGIGCDVEIVKNGLVFALAVGMSAVTLTGGRRRASAFLMGLAVMFFVIAMMLGYLVAGFPLWVVLAALLLMFSLSALGVFVKFSQVRT